MVLSIQILCPLTTLFVYCKVGPPSDSMSSNVWGFFCRPSPGRQLVSQAAASTVWTDFQTLNTKLFSCYLILSLSSLNFNTLSYLFVFSVFLINCLSFFLLFQLLMLQTWLFVHTPSLSPSFSLLSPHSFSRIKSACLNSHASKRRN